MENLPEKSNMDTTIPEKGTYQAVVRRTDKGCLYPIWFTCYQERTPSRAIKFNGQYGHTLFLQFETSARRACRFGWEDITEEWFKHLEDQIPKPTGKSQEKIFNAVNESETWINKQQILKLTKLKDSHWRTAITALVEKGLVEKRGFGSATEYRVIKNG